MNREEENRGSQWHKWDFHVHTPYSILNNEYRCNPNDEDASSFDDGRFLIKLLKRKCRLLVLQTIFL